MDPCLRRGTTNCRSSYLPARVDRHQPAEHRLGRGADEPGIPNHRPECRGFRKAANALDEVAITLLVMRDDLADPRDHIGRVRLIKSRKAGPIARREFHAEEAPAALQHAMRLAQRSANIGYVPDAEDDGVSVEARVIEAQSFCIFDLPL